MAFSDDFNRADGPLGANWTMIAGSASVSSNKCSLGASAIAAVASYTNAGACFAQATIPAVAGAFGNTQLKIKYNTTFGYGCTAIFVGMGTHIEMTLQAYWNGGSASDGPTVIPISNFSSVTVKVSYASGVLRGYANGTEYSHLDDSHNDAENKFAIAAGPAGATLDDYTSDALVLQSMEITPDPLWVGGGPCLITATGTGTAWSDGASPSTTFSADHGEIEVYRWVSATEWELIYTPDDYVGTVTFSETQYGLDDAVTTTVVPPAEGGNGLCQLTPAGATLVNEAGDHYPGSEVLTAATLIHAVEAPELNVDIVQAIAEIWAGMYHFGHIGGAKTVQDFFTDLFLALFGTDTVTVSAYTPIRTTSVKEELEALTDSFASFRNPPTYTIQDMMDNLRGTGTYNHTDLHDDIDAIHTTDIASVIAAVEAARGVDLPTIRNVFDAVQDIATIAGYDLSDVLDAIAAISVTDLTAVMHKLDHIQPSEADTLTTIQTQADAIKLVADQIQVSLGTYRTLNDYTVQDIIDRLDDIHAHIADISTTSAPVWPGLAGATVGAAVPLTDGLVVTGPLHGLLFAVTSQPATAIHYPFGSVHSWSHVGQVIFTSDRGDHERAQSIALDAHLICPKEMQVASSATVRLNNNWGGTVRPFTIT